MLLEKTTRINFLLDFYQALLTDKQRSYMELYYLDDLSLGEIAEQYGVSRQAVYDNIRRTEAMLEEYEEKLRLFGKFRERHDALEALAEMIREGTSKPEEIIGRLEELKQYD
ncbi:putative DNA-binding protein [Bhargavaea cecembensis]|uniref:putative DNA-binding protein n=1 Tax=Bhargavaea cecembensis TaxID=394098 RepID=UPI00059181A8|nr:putative DNA-binding protein [Bhargavaea cecembensis]